MKWLWEEAVDLVESVWVGFITLGVLIWEAVRSARDVHYERSGPHGW